MGTGKGSRAMPARLEGVQRRFVRWRRKRKKAKARIPDPLWDAAVALAETYGVHRTSKALSLDYYSLKKRVEEALADRRGRQGVPADVATGGSKADSASGATFLELPPPAWAAGSECTLELEEVGGARMRVHLKGFAEPDLAALSRSFWESAS